MHRSRMILILVLAAPVAFLTVAPVAASPLISIDDKADWNAAITGGELLPTASTYDALGEHWGAEPFTYYVPELTPLTAAESGEATDGLVMSWGDNQDAGAQAAAWEYVYPVDPDLTGTTLSITVMPPPGIWSIALTLNDAAGGWASWSWDVIGAPAPPFAGVLPAGLPTVLSLDPTSMIGQAGSTSFAQSPGPLFDPKTVISIQAAELAAGAPGWNVFPPVPVSGAQQPWNYWSNLQVVPEPATIFFMTAVGIPLLLKRRSSRG